MILLRWSFNAYSPSYGRSPASGAGSAAQAASRFEKKLAEHGLGQIASFITLPEGTNPDAVAGLTTQINDAKGKNILVETMKAGGGNMSDSPARDYQPTYLRPSPDQQLVVAARDSFYRMLSACGVPGGLVDPGADGTAQREALRRFRMMSIEPVRKSLERELQRNINENIKLKSDNYALDMVSRAQVVDKLTRSGVAINVAMEAVGLNDV